MKNLSNKTIKCWCTDYNGQVSQENEKEYIGKWALAKKDNRTKWDKTQKDMHWK